jgi:hypothetical protein
MIYRGLIDERQFAKPFGRLLAQKDERGVCSFAVTTSSEIGLIEHIYIAQDCHASLINGKHFREKTFDEHPVQGLVPSTVVQMALEVRPVKHKMAKVYYEWLFNESPMRDVYVKKTVKDGGVLLKVDLYNPQQLLCAAIALRYPFELGDRISRIKVLMDKYHVSFTACWALMSQTYYGVEFDSRSTSLEVTKRYGSHDVVHCGVSIAGLAKAVKTGFKPVRSASFSGGKRSKYTSEARSAVCECLGKVYEGDANRVGTLWGLINKHAKPVKSGVGWNQYTITTLSEQAIGTVLQTIQEALDIA